MFAHQYINTMCQHVSACVVVSTLCCIGMCFCVNTSTNVFVLAYVAPLTAELSKELCCSQSLSFGHNKALSQHLPDSLLVFDSYLTLPFRQFNPTTLNSLFARQQLPEADPLVISSLRAVTILISPLHMQRRGVSL